MLTVLLLASGCQGSSGADKPAVAEKQPAAVSLGQPFTMKNSDASAQVQATATRYVDSVSASGLEPLTAGNRYVAVNFVFKNVGKEAFSDIPLNEASVIDAAGKEYDSDKLVRASSAGQQLPTGVNLKTGETAEGFLVYQVPSAAKITSALLKVAQFAINGYSQKLEWKIT